MGKQLKKYSFILYMLIDAVLIATCYIFVTFAIHRSLSNFTLEMFYGLLGYIGIHILLCQLGSQYNQIWQFASIREFAKILLFSLVSGLVFIIVTSTVLGQLQNIAISVLTVMGAVNCIILSRLVIKYTFREKADISTAPKVRLAIVGGGFTCASLLNNMEGATKAIYEPVCIFDDDDTKHGKMINGVKIVGNISMASEFCKKNNVNEILIAIPSATDETRQRILNTLANESFKLRIIPSVEEIVRSGKNNYWNTVREVKIEDLLGRDEIKIEDPEIKAYIEGKVVLVTGGGGSIGSELCRQIIAAKPQQLIILDIYENNAYEIQQELIRKYGKTINLDVEIASVRDKKKIDYIFNKYKPQIVYHAAAHKHVPLMETNPEEAIKNNIMGTYNVAMAANKYKAERFVLVSTDKAVNPTNAMGATKRFCEMIIQSMKERSLTKYVAVRFGNVLGSNGSVVPLFKKQIANGGPVTVTHKDIIRYFMTIPEAVQLVLLTASQAENGNVYVLDMGEPVRIDDFARKMINLSGYVPDVDIKIEYTGLRPGEKLYEELLIDNTTSIKTAHNKIFVEMLPSISAKTVDEGIKFFEMSVENNDSDTAIKALSTLVTTYTADRKKRPHLISVNDKISIVTPQNDEKIKKVKIS